jgi:hypothetical protein
MHIGLDMSVCPHDSTAEPLDEIWYGHHTNEGYPIIILFNLIQPVNTNVADKEICEVGSTLLPLAIGPYNEV